jgi:uncharacterized membrane protein YhaH (DUF805 family)
MKTESTDSASTDKFGTKGAIMEFIKSCFKWHGRIGRKEYITKVLAIFFIGFASILLIILLFAPRSWNEYEYEAAGRSAGEAWGILSQAATIPLAIRRMHDLTLPGAAAALFVFDILLSDLWDIGAPLQIIFAIIVGILHLTLIFKKGTAGPNKYGDDPLTVEKPAFGPYPEAIRSQPPPEPAPPPAKNTEFTNLEKLEILEKLDSLRKSGAITEEEFAQKKKQILKDI